MESVQNQGKRLEEGQTEFRGGGNFDRKNTNVTNDIPKWIYIVSFIQIGQWKAFKNRGYGLGGEGESGEGGKFREKKCKSHKCDLKLNLHRKFNPNRTMVKCSKIGGMVFWFLGDAGEFRKKNAVVTNDIPKWIYIGSLIQIEQCSKIGGMVFWKRGGIWGRGNFEKKYKRHKYHPKMSLCRKVHPNWTMGKCSKIGGMVFGKKRRIRWRKFRKKMQTSQMPPQNESM